MGHSVILIATAVVMSYFISNPRLDKVARCTSALPLDGEHHQLPMRGCA